MARRSPSWSNPCRAGSDYRIFHRDEHGHGGPDEAVSGRDVAAATEKRVDASGWQCDTLLPVIADPELGYVELAGWSPDGERLLVVREGRAAGGLRREFQVLRADTLTIERHAKNPELLLAFRRWAGADWKQHTLALR